jgi:hypothetical protein
MNHKSWIPTADVDHLAERVSELHGALRQVDPLDLAARTGATFLPAGPKIGTFYLSYWNQDISLTFPEFVGRDVRTGEKLGTLDQALLAYYFTISNGTPEIGRWISFSELPDGKFYTQAFQGYTGNKLAEQIGNDSEGFSKAASHLNGRRLSSDPPLGDAAFAFQVLPQVSLLAACWLGDEDFPPSYRILFDVGSSNHLSTDACAILGSGLVRRLAKVYRRTEEFKQND